MQPCSRTNRVLVTGGAGYVGSHCSKALSAAGYMPVVYDNLCTGHRDFVRWGPLIEGDIRDKEKLRSAMREYSPRATVHCAALSLVAESISYPERYYDVNIGGTLNVLGAMMTAGVECLIFSSTAAVYGEGTPVPIPEDAPLRPITPYGVSKLVCEEMIEDIGTAHGIKWVSFRYFNAAGADPEGEIGEHQEAASHLVPAILDTAMGRRPCVKIFGADYNTLDGTAIRDYVHVADVADAHVAALRHLTSGGGSLALNLGSDAGLSVMEVVATAERFLGTALATERAPRRAGDPELLTAKSDRARNVLGWTAHRSTGDQLLEDAWRWHAQRFSNTKPGSWANW